MPAYIETLTGYNCNNAENFKKSNQNEKAKIVNQQFYI